MRHDLLLAPPLTVAPGAPRVREAPGSAALVAPAGLAQRLAPRRPRALAPAVALAAVAAAAHQHLRAAARADECPCAALRLALLCSTHARARKRLRARVPVATGLAHRRPPAPGAILRAHSRSTRVGRGGSNYLLVVAVVAPVLSAQFYRVFTEPPALSQPMPSAPVSAQSQHLGGLGVEPPGQALVDQFSQRQRSAQARIVTPRDPILARHGNVACAP